MLSRCALCKSVADLADVNLRLWLSDGTRQPGGMKETTEYLVGIGQAGSDRAIRDRIKVHMRHVESFLDGPGDVAPMQRDSRVTRLTERPDVKFPTVEQKSLNLGSLAMDELMARIDSGMAEDETLVAAAKIGASVAGQKANRAARGADEKLDLLQRMLSGATE
jgi:hypothetical protein